MKLISISNLGSVAIKVICFVIVASAVTTVTTNKLDTLKATNEVARQGFVSAADRARQLDCLTRNIYWESATEPFEGKVAVAQVTMNRVATGKFGNDVCGVVYQKNVFMEKVVCQFSWACDSVHKNRPINKEAYNESYEVAKKVLLEGFRLSILKDALYYHAAYVNPRWPLDKIGQIGQHIFYRQKGIKI